jgi:hypothetical protein
MKHAPRDLIQAIAVAVSVLTNPTIPTGGPTNLRAVVDRAPHGWRDDGFHYVTVTQVSASAPALRGDGATLADTCIVQVSLWERRDREDPARLQAIIAALDGIALIGQSYAGTEVGTIRLIDLETDLIQHASTYRYPLAR